MTSETEEGEWTGQAPEKGLDPHWSSLRLLLHHLRFLFMSLHRVTLGLQWDRKPGHIFGYPFSTVTCLHVVTGLRPWGPLYRTTCFDEAGVS